MTRVMSGQGDLLRPVGDGEVAGKKIDSFRSLCVGGRGPLPIPEARWLVLRPAVGGGGGGWAEGEVKKMRSIDTDGALRRGGALAPWQVGNQAALLDLRAEGL